ncbi:DUF4185 domain-containing protein [Rhodococcus spongiicola]|uniref:DUF4185 domain-containing protein n=1 Tax=Rhodococcus spongiicola TaxID=2487352 RepID=UPI001F3A2FCC|nr:DUF4185 domain-containing protein [Rhodococcus spongiicola]
MRAVDCSWTAVLSAAVVTVGLSVATVTPVGAEERLVGGPCGQSDEGNDEGNGAGDTASPGRSGGFGSLAGVGSLAGFGSAGSSGGSGSGGSSGGSGSGGSSGGSGSGGSSGGSGSAGGSGSTGSLIGGIGSAAGLLANSLPWIRDSPDGVLPELRGSTEAIEMVTGPGSPNGSIEKYGVAGTDLGIMWDNGQGQVLMAFGDTVGDCDVPGTQWRSNVLFRSNDTTLSDGMRIDSSPLAEAPPNYSKQVIDGLLEAQPGSYPEYTVIPTSGVAVDGVQYVRFMSVRSWDEPGEWTTNYSAIARSYDNGETWDVVRSTVRLTLDSAISTGNVDWQMSAFVPDRGDGFVYEFGTASGRSGPARLARVPATSADLEDPNKYEYWTETGWSPDMEDAEPVIKAPVSELSVQWNDYLGKYIAMYTDGSDLEIRQATNPWGPWSSSQTLISAATLPSLYGGFMHPWATGSDLYFVLTTWDRYNVIYARTDLSVLDKTWPTG